MKKAVVRRNIVFALSVVSVLTVLFACSDNDNKDNSDSSAIVGKWLCVHEEGWETKDGRTESFDEDYRDDDPDKYDGLLYLVFNSDNTYLSYYTNDDTKTNGTYTYNSSDKKLFYENENTSGTVQVSKLTSTELILEFFSDTSYIKDTYERK